MGFDEKVIVMGQRITVWRWLFRAIVMLCGIVIAGGAIGGLYPIGDSLAVLRLPAVMVFTLLVLWTKWPLRMRLWLAGLGLVLLSQHVLMSRPFTPANVAAADSGFLLYHQNLLKDRGQADDWLEHIAAVNPDVLTLVELSDQNRPLLRKLVKDYPFQQFCPTGYSNGEAVLSRFPFVPGKRFCSKPYGLAVMQVKTPGGPVWIVSLHLPWPWPWDQAAEVRRHLSLIEWLDGPVVIAGDFNSVAWSNAVAEISQAIDGRKIGPWRKTFNLPLWDVPIGIDHVLANWTGPHEVAVQPMLGSDHNGLLAHVAWPPVALGPSSDSD